MLQTIEFNVNNKLLTREELDAYDPAAESWQKQFARRYTHHGELNGILNHVENVDQTVYSKFAVSITPYIAQLMDRDDPQCPIRRQYLPTFAEETRPGFATMLDQLGEEGDTVPGTSIVHRYPRRVLFLVSNTCATLCRFCTRKRMVSQPSGSVHKDAIEQSIDYIAANTQIQDVLLSGGDPLTFTDDRLDEILGEIRRRAPHVRFLRLGTRMIVQLPTRITPELCALLEKHRVQMVNTHINHPKEITPLLRARVKMLQKAGIMMGLQTVCLKGVNDDVEVMRELFLQAIEMGIRPYYVYSTDMVEGAHHFIVPYHRMLELYEGLRGWISGPAVPTFIVDGLGGLGKLPIIPSYVREEELPDGSGTTVKCRNYAGRTVEMPGLGRGYALPTRSN
ncbi:MAG TPA: KamA family radical SAM protein [Rhodocyclaceae bacterium]|uniref:KamA family radical SAM protein n=1 Tax=Accumulibacter sp. TaxID=2053492 RepID=UPI002878D228|nr:KamA family radical SAM protein [Accumulibacter sp.]HNB80277.1 KamA family radical SAM protein [Rhodocyclaceae bacterium]MDS4015895.1 KamA family radical SAM protein [Accumulibacter sp.]HMV06651.1 KamA family radical SAM protein [Accumulibacter sp.]HMW64558.1 KamA family radical SAM protein [Accumulibacter sp.]HMW81406.1 KamA family radical SAM protein [Accumulibacter sp.]